MSIPSRSTFKLRSAEPNQIGADGAVWQDSEIFALESRVSAKGIELVVGPDVAEDPGLLAGAVMEIEIAEAGLRGEFLWPQITPRARPKRKNIAANRPRRDVRPGDGHPRSESSGTAEGERVASVAATEPVSADRQAAVPPGSVPDSNRPFAPTESATRPVSAVRPASALMDAHLKALKNATSVPALPLTLAFNDAGRSIVPFDRKTPAQSTAGSSKPPQPTVTAAPAAPVADLPAIDSVSGKAAASATAQAPEPELAPPLIDPHGAHVNLSTALVFESDPNDPNEPKAEENPWAWRKDVTAMLSTKFLAMGSPGKPGEKATSAKPSQPPLGASTHPVIIDRAVSRPPGVAAWVRDNAEAGSTFIKRANTSALPSGWPTYAAGLCAALALGALGLQLAGKLPDFKAATAVEPARAVTAAAAPGPFASVPPAGTFAAPSPADVAGSVAQPGTLFDALTVGETSPRGTAVANISATKALETANSMLLADGAARDSSEGAFWLKRYIRGVIGDERNMRVVTQLGSLYAEPTGQVPDFEKARTLWEIASAAGDPVAMCFLGQLHENGLGLDLDKKTALHWYEHAKQAGGCSSVDEAITRVRN